MAFCFEICGCVNCDHAMHIIVKLLFCLALLVIAPLEILSLIICWSVLNSDFYPVSPTVCSMSNWAWSFSLSPSSHLPSHFSKWLSITFGMRISLCFHSTVFTPISLDFNAILSIKMHYFLFLFQGVFRNSSLWIFTLFCTCLFLFNLSILFFSWLLCHIFRFIFWFFSLFQFFFIFSVFFRFFFIFFVFSLFLLFFLFLAHFFPFCANFSQVPPNFLRHSEIKRKRCGMERKWYERIIRAIFAPYRIFSS